MQWVPLACVEADNEFRIFETLKIQGHFRLGDATIKLIHEKSAGSAWIQIVVQQCVCESLTIVDLDSELTLIVVSSIQLGIPLS